MIIKLLILVKCVLVYFPAFSSGGSEMFSFLGAISAPDAFQPIRLQHSVGSVRNVVVHGTMTINKEMKN